MSVIKTVQQESAIGLGKTQAYSIKGKATSSAPMIGCAEQGK